jgi:hypothetical protein
LQQQSHSKSHQVTPPQKNCAGFKRTIIFFAMMSFMGLHSLQWGIASEKYGDAAV